MVCGDVVGCFRWLKTGGLQEVFGVAETGQREGVVMVSRVVVFALGGGV